MTHAEFQQAYAAGRVKVYVEPAAAARYLGARLLLPLFMLPVLGAGVALALLGWIWIGLAVIAAGIIVPRLIKRSAPAAMRSSCVTITKLVRRLRLS